MLHDAEVQLAPIRGVRPGEVGEFLHAHLNPRLSAPTGPGRSCPPGRSARPTTASCCATGTGSSASSSRSTPSARSTDEIADFCNLGAWCVLEEYRSHGVRLLRAVLAQRGYHFTDLSPSGNVVSLNRRLGFEALDTETALVPHRPAGRSRGVRVVTDHLEHRGAAGRPRPDHLPRPPPAPRPRCTSSWSAAPSTATSSSAATGARELPVFASLLHVGNPGLLRGHLPVLGRHLLLRHGLLCTLRRGAPARAAAALSRTGCASPRPKMFRSARELVAAGRCGGQPLQRARARGLVTGATMRTQLHHLLDEQAVRCPDRPAADVPATTRSTTRTLARTGARPGRRPGRARAGPRATGSAIYLDKRSRRSSRSSRPPRPAWSSCRSTRSSSRPRSATCWATATSGSWSPAGLAVAAARGRSRRAARPRARRAGRRRRRGAGADGAVTVHAYAALVDRVRRRRRRLHPERRPRRRRDPLHLGEHGRPKGVVLSHRNLLVGAESVSSYLHNTRGRRHPRRPAAELRRRAQPAHHRVRGRRARRPRQLPAAGRRARSCARSTASPG